MALIESREYQPNALEQKVIQFWRDNDTFRTSVQNRSQAPAFVFLEGPPTANGMPHAGHVLTRTLKDSVCRYKTMRGYMVPRKAGWDCHGLPVEIEVEKELGLKDKGDIEAYGVAKFNQKCRESVFRYKKDWEWMSERVGFWLDFENPYVTLENEYIESVWWSLKQAWDKKLLYKGFRVSPHCPRCDTALSSHEVAQGYKDIEEPSVFVKFRRADTENEYFLAWTTTPWTLPGNVGLAVGPDIEYVKVKQTPPGGSEEHYWIARGCLPQLRGEYEEVEAKPGSALEGIAYEPLIPSLSDHLSQFQDDATRDAVARSWRVLTADFVTTEDGTGIVHTAAMYGEDDYVLCTSVGTVLHHTVKSDGTFHDFVKPYAGQFVKDADANIIEDLRSAGLLYRVKNYTHSYPFCWRCSTPLLYYARDSWFIRMSQLRDQLVANNDSVNWVPSHVKEGRFGEFIGNVRDWALSRDRYWGTPLPVWTCAKPGCDRRVCVGSLDELSQLGTPETKERVASKELDLHKPAVDELTLQCTKCSNMMHRETPVIDTWYDSGAAQFAQWHYPFNEADKAKAEQPVDFVAEGLDQTRGWFYSLLAESTFAFGRQSYRNVVVNGLVLDEQGYKMSKSKKNYTDPNDVFKEFGADAMRWYLLTSSSPTADKRFFPAAIRDTFARFFLSLWNTFQFYREYAALDKWTPDSKKPDRSDRPILDQWLLDRLDTTVAVATNQADAYNLHKAGQAIETFLVDDVSNWWLRRSRRRFWQETGSKQKEAAYATLHDALTGVARLMAPFAPFLPEALYQDLRASDMPQSVHLTDYPTAPKRSDPTSLEQEMSHVRDLTESARSLRSKAGIKTRIPIAKLTIVRAGDPSPTLKALIPLLKEEANVKAVEFASTASGLEDYEAKIDQSRVGKQLKADAKPVLAAAREADPLDLGRALAKDGRVTLAGQTLTADLFKVNTVAAEGTLKADVGTDTIFLDATLTPELEAEGWAREITRRIQEMRKEARLELQDRIVTNIDAAPSVVKHLEAWNDHIREETRSSEIRYQPTNGDAAKEWDIDGEKVTIAVAKVNA